MRARIASVALPVVVASLGGSLAVAGPSRATDFAFLPAPLAALALLGTVGLGVLLLGASAVLALGARTRWARRAFLAALAVGALYALALVGLGLASHDVVLVPGGEKYFCELDCHLAYAVEALRAARGGSDSTVWTVVLRTRFDETTIAPWRPRDVPLTPNPRRAWLADASGRLYERSRVAEAGLPAAGEGFADWTTPLVPGQSYRTRLAFVLPASTRPEKLLLIDPEWMNRLVLDHEASPLHGHSWLGLPAPEAAVASASSRR